MYSFLPSERFWIFKIDSWHMKLCFLWVNISQSFSHPSSSTVSHPECYGFSVSFKVWLHNRYLASLRRPEILPPSAPYYRIKLKSPIPCQVTSFSNLYIESPALSTHTLASQSLLLSHIVPHISISAFQKIPIKSWMSVEYPQRPCYENQSTSMGCPVPISLSSNPLDPRIYTLQRV